VHDVVDIEQEVDGFVVVPMDEHGRVQLSLYKTREAK
jgi:predicted RNA-binding protein with RPS1 domain